MKKNLLPLAALLPLCAAAQQRYNIVYIMTDDHTAQMLSAYDSRNIQTPNLDRIAQDGVKFTRSFVANSLSGPSRACMLTGKHSHKNGFTNNEHGIFDGEQQTMPKLLQKAGYQTSIVGKWHLVSRPTGFDHWDILPGQGNYYDPDFYNEKGSYKVKGYLTNIVTDKAIHWLDEERDPNKPFALFVHHKACHRDWLPELKYLHEYEDVNFPLPANFYDDYAGREAAGKTEMEIGKHMTLDYDCKIMPRDGKGSHLLPSYLGFLDRLNTQDRAKYDYFYDSISVDFHKRNLTGKALVEYKFQRYMRDYAKVVKSLDDNVGRLLDHLKAKGLLDNTLVVYTSDQGFYMGEHGWFDKRFMYEESLHTPLIISYPGHIKEGVENTDMVQNIDFAPTFLAYAGVQQPKEMTGKPLQPLLAGNKPKNWRKDLYYHYYDYPTYHLVRKHDGVRNDRYKLIYFYGKGGMRAVEENKYQKIPGTSEYNCLKYLNATHYFNDDADVSYYELYDLQNDPDELNNIYGKKGTEKVTKQLMKRLNDYRKELKIDEY